MGNLTSCSSWNQQLKFINVGVSTVQLADANSASKRMHGRANMKRYLLCIRAVKLKREISL